MPRISKRQKELRAELEQCEAWLDNWSKFASRLTVARMWKLRSIILTRLLEVQTEEHR